MDGVIELGMGVWTLIAVVAALAIVFAMGKKRDK